jgi:hypothetical protein
VDSPGRVVFFRSRSTPCRPTARRRTTPSRCCGTSSIPRARRERGRGDFPRQHGLHDQRRGDGGSRRFGFGGNRSNAGQLRRQFAHQSHDGHAVRDDASGIVRGCVTLVGGVAATNQLRVQNGDTITATYFDASANSNVTATAGIDTVPPVISQVAATTDYYNARVTWRTSKPADSAVEYGARSSRPTRFTPARWSRIMPSPSADFCPDHVYYYEVVSRDQAGNTTVDDNNGNLYTFQTLKAPAPPWFDNLESGAPGWSVVPDPGGTEINWTLARRTTAWPPTPIPAPMPGAATSRAIRFFPSPAVICIVRSLIFPA